MAPVAPSTVIRADAPEAVLAITVYTYRPPDWHTLAEDTSLYPRARTADLTLLSGTISPFEITCLVCEADRQLCAKDVLMGGKTVTTGINIMAASEESTVLRLSRGVFSCVLALAAASKGESVVVMSAVLKRVA